MKRTYRNRTWWLLAVTAALSLSAGSLVAEDCIVSTGNVVTLRTKPSGSAPQGGTLRPGASLPLGASLPGWYQSTLDGKKVFASKKVAQISTCPAVSAVTSGPVFEVHVIDVGTGLSVLVHGADFNLLYDAGSNDDTATGDKNRTLAYLNTLRPPVQKLDHVILSHPHRDHVELMPDVITRLAVGEVWNSGVYNDICGYRNLLLAIAARPAVKYHTATFDENAEEAVSLGAKDCYSVQQPPQTVTLKHSKRIAGEDKIQLGNQARMTFLYADGSKQANFNDNSLVVRLDLGSHRILLMGDAEAGGRNAPSTPAQGIEGDLLTCCASDIQAEVLIVGHHGSKTSSRQNFVKAVGAKTFVISAGPTKYATVVLPDEEIVTELEGMGQLFRTDLNDGTCGKSMEKVGPKNDDNPGGCDNVLITLPQGNPLTIDYRHP